MRCDECLTMLDQYVEGEFDEATADSLSAHMATCSECAGAHETLRRERKIYASYLLDAEPTQYLWENLRSEWEKEKVRTASQPQLQRWLAIAFGPLHVTPQVATALVLIVTGLAVGLIMWRATIDTSRHQAQSQGVGVQPISEVNREAHRDSDNADRQASANDNDGKTQPSTTKTGDNGRELQVSAAGRAAKRVIGKSSAVSTVDQVARRAERQYLSAIELLSRDIERRRAVISPALLSQLETELAEVDRNIAATRRVARAQPRDPFAVQYLAVAYEKKVELLREVINQ
jgi:Putative zinc-finger